MNDENRRLTQVERAALQRTARSRTEAHGLVSRAQLVLDCADAGVAEAARRSDVSTSTAAKWWHRYLESGFDGLRDNPRAGRPAASAETVDQVLRYALLDPPAGAKRWSTRTIAQDSGLSQSTVSRIRRRHFPPFDPADRLLPDTSTAILVYADARRAGCTLGFQRTSGVPVAVTPAPALVDAVETVSCAALLRRPHTGYPPDDTAPRALHLLLRAAERLPPTPPVTLLIDVPLDDAAQRWLAQHPGYTVHSVPPDDWHASAHRLIDILDARQLPELQDVQQQLRRARSADAVAFTWTRSSGTAAAPGHAAGTVPESAGGDLGLVIEGVCAALDDGSLIGGDLIPVRGIARRTGMAPTRGTECLARLAAEAIVDQQGADYLLPAPSASDVIETYTARGLLGTAVVRRLAGTGTTLPPLVDELLDRLAACDELGLSHEAYRVDLDVQNEIARAAGMPRIGWMFIQLSLQLRLLTVMIGLDYRYPTGEIITDDHRIVAAIRGGDPAAAVDAWRKKVDNCANYMLSSIESARSRP